jgi:hypothetical protein
MVSLLKTQRDCFLKDLLDAADCFLNSYMMCLFVCMMYVCEHVYVCTAHVCAAGVLFNPAYGEFTKVVCDRNLNPFGKERSFGSSNYSAFAFSVLNISVCPNFSTRQF